MVFHPGLSGMSRLGSCMVGRGLVLRNVGAGFTVGSLVAGRGWVLWDVGGKFTCGC